MPMTGLETLALEALKGKKKEEYQHSCIPVFIELKKFTDKITNDLREDSSIEVMPQTKDAKFLQKIK